MPGNYTYTNFKSLVQDHLRDDDFTSDYTAEILRAANLALDDINSGDFGQKNTAQAAFTFQKKVIDISFVNGTTDYDMDSTLSIDLNTFKFPSDHGLRIDSDEDTYFTYRTPSYFFRRAGGGSSEKMFAITKDAGTWYLKINFFVTDTLNFEFYDTDMIAVSGGSSRAAHIVNDNDTFLFADRYIGTLLNLTLNKLYGQLKGFIDPTALFFLKEGRRKLKQLIESEGVKMVRPSSSIKIHSEWGMRGHRVSTN